MVKSIMTNSHVIQEFTSSASVHGISKFGTTKLRRSIWIVLVLICTLSLGGFLIIQFIEYTEHSVSSDYTVSITKFMDFPAVTVCNLNQVKRSIRGCSSRDLTSFFYDMSELYLYHLNFNDLNPLNESMLPSGEDIMKCFHEHSQIVNQLLLFCSWLGESIQCNDIFEERMTEYGKCFTFNGNLNKTVRKVYSQGPFSGLNILLNINTNEHFFAKTLQTGIKVMVHPRHEEPLPEWRGFLVGPGMTADATIYQTKKSYLPSPYGDCIDTSSPDFINPLKRYSQYTTNACSRECFTDYIVSECGCRSILDPGTEPLCGESKMIQCYIRVAAYLTTKNISCPHCHKPCHETQFTAVLSYAKFGSSFTDEFLYNHSILPERDSIEKNLIQLRVFYDDMVITEIVEKPSLKVSSIFGKVGGYMGLFLGASVLSVVELIELVVLLVVSKKKVHTKQQRQSSLNVAEVQESMSKDELSTNIDLSRLTRKHMHA